MDPRDQFQPTARELLEQHVTETPDRPLANYAELREARASYDDPSLPGQNKPANFENNQRNAEYFEYARAAQQGDNTARENLEQHIEKSQEAQLDRTPAEGISAREALMQHLEGAKREVTEPNIDPFNRGDLTRQQQEYER